MRLNINKIISVGLTMCLLAGAGIFNSCSKDDKEVSAVTLSVFGPSPALRGGTIKFIGTNLDKVSSVVLKNNIEITDITHTSSSEMSIVIPQDAAPGAVTLKSTLGDITTKTPLTFSEPISIDTYTTSSVKAGDTFTITGDYLNLIAQVIFTDGAVVDSSNFISQTRKKIEVTVPKAAKTGKVAVSNGAEIPVIVYTTGSATVTDPTTLTTISPATVKAKSNLTIAGTYLNLVKSVIFPDGLKVDSADITFNTAKTTLTVAVPEKAKEGTIKVVTYSGTEMTVPQALKLTAPAITSLGSANVKNGGTLQITGTDLDLVTSVTFAGAVDGVITAQSETSLTVAVPLTATDGAAVLNTNSGLTASTAALTMVTPAFTSISPLALTAGDNVTIVGTDLDLVRKVVFTGGTVAVTPAEGTTLLTVTVPTTCAGTGSVTFETVNGTKVASTDQLAIKASTTPAITSITEAVAPGGLMTITGKNLNNVESIYFEDNVKAVLYGVRSATSIDVYIPVAAKHGKVKFTINSYDGETIESPYFTYGTDPIISTTVMLTNFNGGGNSQSTWGSPFGFGTPSIELDGTQCMIGNNNVNGWLWSWAANWGTLPALSNPNNYVFKMDICITKAAPGVSAGMCFRGWNNSINLGNIFENTTNGQWVTLSFDLNKDNAIDGTGDFGMYIYAGSTVDLSGVYIDNFRFDLKSTASGVAPRKNLYGF